MTDNIICMKWGTQYGPEYVNNLYAMVKRHMTRPFTFVCFTDDNNGIHEFIETRPIPEIPLGSAPIWSGWRKIASLSPELGLEGPTLFLDLDLIITENMDCFFDYEPGEFCIIENWTTKGTNVGNSSVYRYEAGKHTDVFDDFCVNHEQIYKDITNEQTYLTWKVAENHAVKWWPDEWVHSFKRHSVPKGVMRFFKTPTLPKDSKMLVFHGPPKPPEAAEGKWPPKNKFLKPARWIWNHWHDRDVLNTKEKAA